MSFTHNVKLAGTVTVGPKGQVVIPSEVRDAMKIASGDKLIALYLNDKQSVVFITEQQAQEFVSRMGAQFVQFKETLRGGNKQ